MKKSSILLSVVLIGILKSQTINTYAGNGIDGYSGDGEFAIYAQLNTPRSVKVIGNDLYISEAHRIRKVNAAGIITTIAGTSSAGYSNDGGLANLAQINNPTRVVMDKFGNIYFGDSYNYRIRKIDKWGIITTVAGTGVYAWLGAGNGGPAINAQFAWISGIAIDSKGMLYITDSYAGAIRRIDTLGIIKSIVGGNNDCTGDGGLALNAKVYGPSRPVIDKNDNLYFIDGMCYLIRKIDANGVITKIAGTIGANGFSGDGGLAISAGLDTPSGIDIDSIGNIYFSEKNRIRKINTSGIVSTIAGNGTPGFSGDGGLAVNAKFDGPREISLDNNGNLFVSDYWNQRVRIICPGECPKPNEIAEFIIYPNPNNGSFKIETESNACLIIIYNSLGQKIHEQKLTKGINKINLTNFSVGLYNYSIAQNEQFIKTGKVTIQ